ncbi:hypothetical protein Emag_006065 [Eimeria magna]
MRPPFFRWSSLRGPLPRFALPAAHRNQQHTLAAAAAAALAVAAPASAAASHPQRFHVETCQATAAAARVAGAPAREALNSRLWRVHAAAATAAGAAGGVAAARGHYNSSSSSSSAQQKQRGLRMLEGSPVGPDSLKSSGSAVFVKRQTMKRYSSRSSSSSSSISSRSSRSSRSSSSGKGGGSSDRNSSNGSNSSLFEEAAAVAPSADVPSDASSGHVTLYSSSSSSSSGSSRSSRSSRSSKSSRSSRRGSSNSSIHSGSSLDAPRFAEEAHDESSRETSLGGPLEGEDHEGAPVEGSPLRVATTDGIAGAAAAAVAAAASSLPLPAAAKQILRQLSLGFAGGSEGVPRDREAEAPSGGPQGGPLGMILRVDEDSGRESQSAGEEAWRFPVGRRGLQRGERGKGPLGGKRKGGPQRGFEHLPTGCLHVVFRFLMAKEILRVSGVCTAWREAVHGCVGAFMGVTSVCLDDGWLKLDGLRRQQVLLQFQRLQQLEVRSTAFKRGGLTLKEVAANAPDFTALGLRGLQRILNQMPSLRRLTLGLELLADGALEGAVERTSSSSSSSSSSRRGRGSSSSRGARDGGRRVVSLGDGWTYEAASNNTEEEGPPFDEVLGGPQGWIVQPPAGGEEVGGPEPIGGRSRGRPYRGRFTEANLSDIFAIACVRAGSTGSLKKIVLLQKEERMMPPELMDEEGGEGHADRPLVTSNTFSELVSGAASFCARYVSEVFGSASQEAE